MSQVGVTSTDVLNRFGRSQCARGEFEAWKSDPRRADFAERVLAHTNRVVQCVGRDDVLRVAETTTHALGNVKKVNAESVQEVMDWHPNAAFSHVFGLISEHLGVVPTYEEFHDAAASSGFSSLLWDPAKRLLDDLAASGYQKSVVRDALRWRVGNAYYSFLREAFVMAELRDRSLDVRSHPLADALFHVDFWVGDVNIDLFVGNGKFRSRTSGRKVGARTLLGDADPPFEFVEIEMLPASRFGHVHLPSPEQLDRAERQIVAALGTQRAGRSDPYSSSWPR